VLVIPLVVRLTPHEPRSSRREEAHSSNVECGVRNAELTRSLLLRKWDWRKRSPSPRPSPPGEGEARTVPGIFAPFGVELLHGHTSAATVQGVNARNCSWKSLPQWRRGNCALVADIVDDRGSRAVYLFRLMFQRGNEVEVADPQFQPGGWLRLSFAPAHTKTRMRFLSALQTTVFKFGQNHLTPIRRSIKSSPMNWTQRRFSSHSRIP